MIEDIIWGRFYIITGALAACSYIPSKREKIFQVLYKALNSKTSELQEVAHDCMKNVSYSPVIYDWR